MRGVWNNTEKSLTFVIRGAGLFHLHIVVWGQFCNALLDFSFLIHKMETVLTVK